jgi:hypothetical protein
LEDKVILKPKAAAPGKVIDKSIVVNTNGGSWLKSRKRKPEERLKAKQPW